jgi:transcriptional regulator with XRE-family HTH domain
VFEIGSTLRRARDGHGLELADVEAATRIRARYLAELEEEHFDDLPDGYARTFLRSYAGYLGLDAQRLVDEYDMRFPPKEPARARRPARGRRDWTPSWAVVVLLAGGVAVLALLVAGQFGSGSRKRTPELSGLRAPPARPVVASPGRTRAPRPRRVEGRPRVVLRALRGDCWIAVRLESEGGRLLYENLLRPGQAVSFVRLPLWVRIGAPVNLVLTLDGRRLRAFTRSGPLNVVVGKSGIRSV